MLPKNIAFVDIETTGARLSYDRIIEIAILRVEENRLVKSYQTLINPQTYVSPFIENLTGIKAADLATAPVFDDVKNEIAEILEDCFFAAHNVRFDYGFLKHEFSRFDISFSPKQFCTVKLSRSLFPKYKKHNLDSLIERFSFACEKRHRAFDDARVLWEFFQLIQKKFSKEKVEQAFAHILKKPTLPINLSLEELESLPSSPGVYIFYDQKGAPLYIGKSINIKDRVLSHFSSDHTTGKQMNMCQQIHAIKTIPTAGELGALLREARLIKTLAPIYNRKLRLHKKLVIAKKQVNTDGFQTVILETTDTIDNTTLEHIVGVFKSIKQAKTTLIDLVKSHNLCEKMLSLTKNKSACFSYQLGWCKGACVNKEDPTRYNLRFLIAFAKTKLKSWPFVGPICIEEHNAFTQAKEAFYIDNWHVLRSTGDDTENVFEATGIFDLDTYKILAQYLLAKNPSYSLKNITYDNIP